MKKKFIVIIAVLIAIMVVEVFLRIKWGFCDTVLIQADPDYEYIAQPNQDRHRFGNHVYYNEFSMRSKPVVDTSFVILGLGDSVLNGGIQSDNKSIATTLLENNLQQSIPNARVLNVSAGSWGPDNTYEYLEKFGNFNAKLIFLVVSSHDAHDNITHQQIVDVSPSFPSTQYKSAIWELCHRYLIPRVANIFKSDKSEIDKRLSDPIANGSKFNTGFENLKNYSVAKKIPLIVYLHADSVELKNKSYNEQGQEIINFCEKNNIKLIKELDYPMKEEYLSDDIHMNTVQGQKFIADNLLPVIKEQISKK